MRLILPLVFFVAACGSSSSIKSATYLEDIEYFEDAEEGDEADEEGRRAMQATDCLSIQPAANGAIRFDFAFHFPYDHMCEMGGEADLESPGVWEVTTEDGCRLVIDFDGKSWSVNDPDSSCREHWCGARGHIGHSFPTSKARALTKCGS